MQDRPSEAFAAASGTEKTAGECVHRVTLHGFTAEIRAPLGVLYAISRMLSGYDPGPSNAEPHLRVEVCDQPNKAGSYFVRTPTTTYADWADPEQAAIRVEWLFITEAVKWWSRFIHVHAGIVATGAQSALLIGRSGSGKSTTTVALAMEGLDVYSDDVSIVERGTRRPWSVPRPIKLDPTSIRMLGERGLRVPDGHQFGESVDRLVLPGLPPSDVPGPALTAAFFFAPDRAAGATVRPITGAEAIMRLSSQSTSELVTTEGPTSGAIEIVDSLRCYELVAGDLGSTVRAVRGALGEV